MADSKLTCFLCHCLALFSIPYQDKARIRMRYHRGKSIKGMTTSASEKISNKDNGRIGLNQVRSISSHPHWLKFFTFALGNYFVSRHAPFFYKMLPADIGLLITQSAHEVITKRCWARQQQPLRGLPIIQLRDLIGF
jgi:hypothetical protein